MLSSLIKKHVNNLREVKELSDYFETGQLLISKEQVMKAIEYVSDSLEVIIYGGVITYPEIMGYHKHLRKPSNDVDALLTSIDGLKTIGAYYLEQWDVGLIMINSVPVTISYQHIHDWQVKDWFIKEVINKQGVNYATPTNVSVLKIRRIKQSSAVKGKDYIDIASLIMGSGVNDEQLINRALSESASKQELKMIINRLMIYGRQLRKQDRSLFNKRVQRLIEIVNS